MINVQFIFPQYLDVLLSPIRVCFIIRFLWNHDSAGSKRNLLQSCNYESNLCYFHNTGRELLKTEIKINSIFDQAGLQVPFCKEKEVLKSKYHCSSSSVGKYNFHFFLPQAVFDFLFLLFASLVYSVPALMAPHQVFTFIVSDDLVAFDFDIMTFNVFVIWFIDCLKMTMLKNWFLFKRRKICLCSCHRTFIVIFGYEMHKYRKLVLVLWNRCNEKIKYEKRKIYSSTLNMK